jgi:hypothetical protein
LLHRKPVQGKAALDALFAAVGSSTFPSDFEKAKIYLESSTPLPSARKPLVRDFSIGLATDLVTQKRDVALRRRQVSALKACLDIRRDDAEYFLLQNIPDIISKTGDSDWGRLLELCAEFPFLWDAAGQGTHLRFSEFVKTGDVISLSLHLFNLQSNIHALSVDGFRANQDAIDELENLESIQSENPSLFRSPPDLVLGHALQIENLKPLALRRIRDLDHETLAEQIELLPHPGFLDGVILRLESADSFREGERAIEELLMPLADVLTPLHTLKVLEAIGNNRQVWDANGVRDKIPLIYKSLPCNEEVARGWTELARNMASSSRSLRRDSTALKSLAVSMSEAYPEQSQLIHNHIEKLLADMPKVHTVDDLPF